MEFKLNPEDKAKWVAALRSGQYTQGRGELKDYYGCFCCLGVACEIGIAEEGIEGLDPGIRHANILTKPSFMPLNEQEKLAILNDTGKSFIEIADHIEKEL